MLVVYIGVASFSVVIVSFFVDGLPRHLVNTDTTNNEVSDNGYI